MGVLGWSLTIVGLLAGVLSLMTLIGVFLPRDHVASREVTLKQTPGDVWTRIRALESWPTWWTMVAKVEPLPPRDGLPAFMLHYADGRNKFALVVRSESAPTEMVTEISDVNKMFEGTWTYSISPTSGGCKLCITERGSVPNPLIRFMARMMMSPHQYIDSYLKGITESF